MPLDEIKSDKSAAKVHISTSFKLSLYTISLSISSWSNSCQMNQIHCR